MNATAKPARTMSRRCGYCNDGQHDLCPTAVRNGDGTPMICPCCSAKPPKCLDCKNVRVGEVSEEYRVCIDREGCRDEQARRREAGPVAKFLREREQRLTTERAERRADPYEEAIHQANVQRLRPSSGECRCCGEPTKGGKFLPGHDSRFLARLAGEVQALIDAGDRAEEIADAKRRVLAALDDTPALRAKLERKLS